MLRLILFSFRLDLASELAPFSLHSGCSLEPFWFHFGSIFVPFGVHFGTIWLLLRGPVEEKFPSKIGDRWGHSPLLHFESFWAQKGATTRSKIDQKSIQNRCKNQWEIRLGFGSALGVFLVDFGMILGLALSIKVRGWGRASSIKVRGWGWALSIEVRGWEAWAGPGPVDNLSARTRERPSLAWCQPQPGPGLGRAWAQAGPQNH